jgi:hypothetical protein
MKRRPTPNVALTEWFGRCQHAALNTFRSYFGCSAVIDPVAFSATSSCVSASLYPYAAPENAIPFRARLYSKRSNTSF